MKRRKIVSRIIIGIGATILIGLGIFSYVIGKDIGEGMMAMEKEQDTEYNSKMQLKEWEYDLSAFESKYTPEEIGLTAQDGQKLTGYYYTSNGEKQNDTVLVVVGMGGQAICMDPWTEMYLEQGYNVFALDRRGTGKSKGGKLTYGYNEKMDLMAFVGYLKANIGSHKLIVHGQSVGGTVVGVYSQTNHAQTYVDGFILESPMKSLETMFLGYMRDEQGKMPNFIEQYFVQSVSGYLKFKEGFSFKDVDLVSAEKNNYKDTLVIGCTKDQLCTLQDSEEIFEQVAAKHKDYYVADAEHIEGYISEPENYRHTVINFIQQINE